LDLQGLGFTAQQQLDFKEEANKYFQENFGFGPTSRDVSLTFYETNPLVEQRCVVLSGEETIPKEGFKIRDGGWMVTVMNPNGKIWFCKRRQQPTGLVYILMITRLIDTSFCKPFSF